MAEPEPRHRRRDAPAPGDALVTAGAVLAAMGTVCLVVDVVAFLVGHPISAKTLLLAGFLAPTGLALALLGLARTARAWQRLSARHRLSRR